MIVIMDHLFKLEEVYIVRKNIRIVNFYQVNRELAKISKTPVQHHFRHVVPEEWDCFISSSPSS